jgi:tetratricopeptide (TPR) repeat protein
MCRCRSEASPCRWAPGVRLAHHAAAVFLCVILTFPRGAAAVPPAAESWTRIDALDFIIFTKGGDKQASRLARDLTAFRKVLQPAAAAATALVPDTTVVIVFDDAASFAPYHRDRQGTPDNSAGRFIATPLANFVVIDASADKIQRTILHEYVHYLLRDVHPPLFLNEGLAEYFSTMRVHDSTVEVGLPIEDHVKLLLQVSPTRLQLPLDKLLQVRVDSPEYNESSLQGIFYAESWLLVHFVMMEQPGLRPCLDRLASCLESGGGSLRDPRGGGAEACLQSAFGKPGAALETALLAYLRKGDFRNQTLERADRDERVQYTPRPATRAEVLYNLGCYLAFASPWEAAMAEDHLQAALAQQPQNPRYQAAMGMILNQRGRHTDGDQMFDSAMDASMADERILLLYANAKLARCPWGEIDFLSPGPLPTAAADARALYARCVAQPPSTAEELRGMGMTYLFDPEHAAEGVEYLEAAQQMGPWDAMSDLSLAALLSRLERDDEAMRILQRLSLRATTQEPVALSALLIMRMRARRQMHAEWIHSQVLQAREIASKGDLPGAVRQLDFVITAARDSESAQEAVRLRGELTRRQDERQTIAAAQRAHELKKQQVELYNKAISAMNSKNYSEAYDILSRLSITVQDTMIARHVKNSLAKLPPEAGKRHTP